MQGGMVSNKGCRKGWTRKQVMNLSNTLLDKARITVKVYFFLGSVRMAKGIMDLRCPQKKIAQKSMNNQIICQIKIHLEYTWGERALTWCLGKFMTSAQTVLTLASQWRGGTFTFCSAYTHVSQNQNQNQNHNHFFQFPLPIRNNWRINEYWRKNK